MRVAIYVRVSTRDQDPEYQLNELREYAARRGFETFKEYQDSSSGLTERRPKQAQFHQLMKDAYERRFDCVLVWKFDRFARSLSALLDALKTFEAIGISFISLTQQIDTSTPMGRMLFSMVGAFAEFEKEIIVERTRAGTANARRKGRIGGPRRNIAIEAEVRKLHEQGVSLREIGCKVKRSPAGVLLILKRQAQGYIRWNRNRKSTALPSDN